MADTPSPVTQILHAVRQGQPGATERLYELVYSELRRMARFHAAGEAASSRSPSSIVHEAYLRLVSNAVDLTSRAHFFGAAAEAMRRILVDDARARRAQKRGGPERDVSLHETAAVGGLPPVELLDVHRALDRLELEDERSATIVKLRYFAGMTVPQTAAALDISERSVHRGWTLARAWLIREMGRDASDTPS